MSIAVIPLKSELAVELLEKGKVRFWLQAEKISANGKVDYVFNDNALSQGEVGEQQRKLIGIIHIHVVLHYMIYERLNSHVFILVLQKYKMNFDKNTGVIEMIMESLTPADEGTFTFQLQDGKATNQSSLVLIGDGTSMDTKSF